ncbi:tail fiber domain-containing protein [Zymomonas mobilis]|uniref:Peptidase S74 domain-containing protein n=1 Tax=Zymomonas mobilis subsp. pomaceae (strain ATCC 29192 / DSM 22645 / JCM 10191 / CCUG 17912 / NBRC 13757 / NCIMB 11200 / NRRL B-4491 / Barker I) TaxID=579138 RepID=F8ESD3_ZYMMT|nr:tail fiber domain-containing protein [Zymomonas mobilis]AEI37708.1 hypothetical protein Zymop_0807 [Zymomonas mobilis subsp. pomaceae ATCC 29192]MDX5949075.1 tail fiber domain-containing protein [Zymomonas mobilis subsp. pomaceae]GEB88880.1 hypothetical protein ZMO02_05170 [Zymomonas mobilis subsp. pomaceae]
MSSSDINNMNDSGYVADNDWFEIARPTGGSYASYKAQLGYVKNLIADPAVINSKLSYSGVINALGYEPVNVDLSNLNGSVFQQKVALSYGQITAGLGYEPANKDMSNVDGIGLVSKIDNVRGASPLLTTGGEMTASFTCKNEIIQKNAQGWSVNTAFQDDANFVLYYNNTQTTVVAYSFQGPNTAFCFHTPVQMDGNLFPSSNGVVTLGQPNQKWAEIYASNGAINTSDAREKDSIEAIPDSWLDVWGTVVWQKFKFKKAIEEKGEKARWHVGLIAQEIEKAFKSAGLDPEALGLLCHDRWDAYTRQEETDQHNPDGTPIYKSVTVPAGESYGLRYSECQAIESAWQRREIAKQHAEISALKSELSQKTQA